MRKVKCIFCLISHTDHLAPKYQQESQSFLQEGWVGGMACCSQVDCRSWHLYLFLVLELLSDSHTFYFQPIVALSGSKEEDHD